MNHQSFEHWIFQGETPPAGEADQMAPSPGFSQRWLQRWQAESARAERIKAFWLTFISGVILLMGAWFLVQQNLHLLSEPSSLLIGLVNGIVDFFTFLTVVSRVGSSLAHATPSFVWLALASMAGVTALFSVLALNRFVTQKGALR